MVRGGAVGRGGAHELAHAMAEGGEVCCWFRVEWKDLRLRFFRLALPRLSSESVVERERRRRSRPPRLSAFSFEKVFERRSKTVDVRAQSMLSHEAPVEEQDLLLVRLSPKTFQFSSPHLSKHTSISSLFLSRSRDSSPSLPPEEQSPSSLSHLHCCALRSRRSRESRRRPS